MASPSLPWLAASAGTPLRTACLAAPTVPETSETDAAEYQVVLAALRSGELSVKMSVVGVYAAEQAVVKADDMKGACDSATHVVTGFATGAFGELQSALNTIWHAPPAKAGGMWELIRVRLLSFTMVVVVGFLPIGLAGFLFVAAPNFMNAMFLNPPAVRIH